jgi:LuxR family transcriptional regulator, maltose regulon positive regulatory protein
LIDLDAPLVRSMLGGYEARTLTGWLERFPHEVLLTNAHLCLVYAWALFSSEISDAHKGPLAVAEQLFQAEGNRTGLGLASTLQAFIAAEGAPHSMVDNSVISPTRLTTPIDPAYPSFT